MAIILISNPQGNVRRIPLEGEELVVGRATNAPISLEGANVSRRHARFFRDGASVAIEDLGSSNGTFLNGMRIAGKAAFTPNDILRIGSYTLRLEAPHSTPVPGAEMTIQRQTLATAGNQDLYRENPAQKLQAVLELAHALANTLDVETLLNQYLEQVFKLLPKTDRALIVFLDHDEPVVRLKWDRRSSGGQEKLFSRSLLKQVIDKGVAVLAGDVQTMDANMTLNAMGVRSVLCVPLRAHESAVFGVVQLDRFQAGNGFGGEDLNLLTAVTLQISMVLEKARLHEKLISQERIAQELALAREIQLAFLPQTVPEMGGGPLDLVADLEPAQEVSGDFYDFIRLDESRLAVLVADVSGKGMPAALFMSMVRALLRQIAKSATGPADMLMQLNKALAPDNPKFMFVTVLLGIYQVKTGDFVFSRAGHPAPLLRRASGAIEEIPSDPGCLIGIEEDCPPLKETAIHLDAGDTIIFYTDGVTEAAEPKAGVQFGCPRLLESLQRLPPSAALRDWISSLKDDLEKYCHTGGPQDDVTLLLLRHGRAG